MRSTTVRHVTPSLDSVWHIAIAATFTAEPLEESLRFWIRELDLPVRIEFAPYNQVFQQVLDADSVLSQNQRGLNVILARLLDWSGDASETDCSPAAQGQIRRTATDLVTAVKSRASRTTVPWLVLLCPASAEIQSKPARGRFLRETEEALASGLAEIAGVYVMTSAAVQEAYPVADYDDSRRERLGHVPYTRPFFAGLGTTIIRQFHALQRPPRKVIVLDCDNTLWSGVCGEDGAMGVTIDAPRRSLQEFMRRQQAAGMLLCLCSKNNVEDIEEVFARRQEMTLSLGDFVSTQINWQPKSENLKRIAAQLRVDLDSFVFVDDSPVECAEVEANCPGILALQLPSDPESIPRFLQHVWAFDRPRVTDEDRQRTQLYQRNVHRQELLRSSLDLGDYIANLDVQIAIGEMTAGQLARCAQLTERTNQFNFTTIRRRESELSALSQAGRTRCLTVQVQDRFGDYGLVGLMIVESADRLLTVDTFLLSCRALGRGVEHRMLSRLGEIALELGLSGVEVRVVRTRRNVVAVDFMERMAPYRQQTDDALLFVIPGEAAAAVRFDPSSKATVGDARDSDATSLTANRLSSPSGVSAPRYTKIAAELHGASEVLARIDITNRRARPAELGAYEAPRNPTESGPTWPPGPCG